MVQRSRRVARPDGPLTKALWPKDFRTDGAGVLQIPPLETGRQTIRVQGADERSVDVPPLASANAIETAPIAVEMSRIVKRFPAHSPLLREG